MEDRSFRAKIVRIVATFLTVIAIMIGFDKIKYVLDITLEAFSPFIVGAIIALILNIPMRFFENKVFRFKCGFGQKIKRPLSILCSILLIILIIGIIALIVVPEVANTVGEITNTIPSFVRDVMVLIEENVSPETEWLTTIVEIKEASASWDGLVAYATKFLGSTENASNAMLSVVDLASGLIGSFVEIIIAMFFALYVLVEKERVTHYFSKLSQTFLSEKTHKGLSHSMHLLHLNFEDFLSGQCLECFIVALIFTVITFIFGFECSIVVGIAMLFLALIPYVGNFAACGLGMVLTLAMEGTSRAILYGVLFCIVQFLDTYLLYPRVMGIKVQMPPLLIFVSSIVGGSLFGVFGLIFMIPIATTAYMLVKEKMVAKGVEKPKEPEIPKPLFKKKIQKENIEE